jgi:hypothetical protein
MAERGWRVAQLARVRRTPTLPCRTRRRQEDSLGMRVGTGLATRWGTAELLREVSFVNEAGELEREIAAYGITGEGGAASAAPSLCGSGRQASSLCRRRLDPRRSLRRCVRIPC